MASTVPCTLNCLRNLVESLDDRQDMRKNLSGNLGTVSITLEKKDFSDWLKTGGTWHELCLFVSHTVLHVYSYVDTTLIGGTERKTAHVMRHGLLIQELPILQALKEAMYDFYAECCHGLEENRLGLFDVLYSFRKHTTEKLKQPKCTPGTLTINVTEEPEYLTFELNCESASDQRQNNVAKHLTLSHLLNTAQLIFDQIAANPEMQLQQLCFTRSNEPFKGLESNMEIKNETGSTMDSLFSAIVERMPNKTALIFGSKKYTYAELDARAVEVASWIEAITKLESESVIALCLDRTELIIVAILAVWKVGGAYVPIDPNYPKSRMQSIIEDCKPLILLTDGTSRPKLPAVGCPVLDMSQNTGSTNYGPKVKGSGVSDLALIIYTSGTTGQPKGVMIRHSSLVNQCADYRDRYPDLCSDEVVVQLFNYAFNAFLEPLTLAISEGLTLVMVPFNLLLEPRGLIDYFVLNGVSHVDGTPSLATQFNLSRLKNLKRVAVGGEPLTHAHRSIFLKNNPNIRLYNIYGNSEGTLCTLTADVTESDNFNFTRQVKNKGVYLLSSDLKTVPAGAVGELCLSGAGIAPGYLKNEVLTNEKFLRNMFYAETTPNSAIWATLYRTGDLGMVMASGGIKIVGRKDLQVKVSGIRIEIAEVENEMLKIEGVAKSAVIWKEGSDGNQLVGFFVPSNLEISAESVKALLKNTLPDYMVPSKLFSLEAFPLTPNGKVCRAQLTNSIPLQAVSDSKKIEVKNLDADESAISQIWEEVLCLPPGSVEKKSNFFSLGGNSLLVIKVISVAFEKLGIQLNAAKIMENGGSFESFLNHGDAPDPELGQLEISKRLDNHEIPISVTQERILASCDSACNHFVFEFKIAGKIAGCDGLLARISNIVQQHEILRTIYPKTRFGIRYQKVVEKVEVDIQKLRKSLESIQEFSQRLFDLATMLPIRVGLLESLDGRIAGILVVVHSIAMDFQAQTLFLQQIAQEILEPKKGINHGDFAYFQKNHAPGPETYDLVYFWKQRLNFQPKFAPIGFKDLHHREIRVFDLLLGPSEFESLRNLARDLEVTLYDIFLSAHVLSQWALEPEENDVVVGTFLSLRDHHQLYDMMGNLTQIVPLNLEMDQSEAQERVICNVAESVKVAKSKQCFPMDMATVSLGGVQKLVNGEFCRFLFDLRVTPAHQRQFILEGNVYKLVEAQSASPLLKMTQAFTTVDIAEGCVKVLFTGCEDVVEEMRNHFAETLKKLTKT